MELRSIQYFVQVADEGSITRTADKIGIAQPALTRHIKQLEAELGTQLLTRLPRGVRLTTSGRDFLDHARTIILEVSRASEHVRGKSHTPRGTVVMGTSPTLAPLLLPGCVAQARQQSPTVTLKVVEGFSPQLLDALLTGRLDLAVMTNPPRTTALALTPLCSEPLVVLAPPGARGTRHAFSLAELCGTPFILTVGLRTLIEQQLATFGVALCVEAEVDSIEAIRRLLISGIGMTIMPVSAFHDEIRAGHLAAYPIEDANLHRILILARPMAEARSAAIDEIEHIVRAEMARLLQAGFFRMPAAEPAVPGRRRALARPRKSKRRAPRGVPATGR
ncbi:MAG TPA: LysR family transcriptional regulator [Casimicrobiaceae bacterium]|jgi:LysR family nitrogen assimilation transcriptional regulator|nr:LysR family transcriptional regulator [Casimicrobiaceae bacterium]